MAEVYFSARLASVEPRCDVSVHAEKRFRDDHIAHGAPASGGARLQGIQVQMRIDDFARAGQRMPSPGGVIAFIGTDDVVFPTSDESSPTLRHSQCVKKQRRLRARKSCDSILKIPPLLGWPDSKPIRSTNFSASVRRQRQPCAKGFNLAATPPIDPTDGGAVLTRSGIVIAVEEGTMSVCRERVPRAQGAALDVARDTEIFRSSCDS